LLEADVKKLTCRDLGGPCDAEITGNSFQEVGKKSYDHVVEQISRGDEAHRAAAEKMRNASPEEQKAMMAEFEKNYQEAPEA
jgi:predicted small metal-binding protein